MYGSSSDIFPTAALLNSSLESYFISESSRLSTIKIWALENEILQKIKTLKTCFIE